MTSNNKPQPGVSRENRISDDGLERLRKQLIEMPLSQWVKRYGDEARRVMKQFDIELLDK